MEIIDGQGRLEALQQLQMPVEYRIIEGIGINECRAMNLKPTSWSINDFVDSYAEYGNENYVRLKALNKKYDLGYSLLFSISKHKSRSGKSSQNDLRLGTFTLSAESAKKVDEICNYLKEFKDIQKKIGGRKDLFYAMVAWCAMQPDVDLERLKVQMHSNHSTFTPFAQSEISLREISKAYNKGYSKSKHRYFDYEWKTKHSETVGDEE